MTEGCWPLVGFLLESGWPQVLGRNAATEVQDLLVGPEGFDEVESSVLDPRHSISKSSTGGVKLQV